MNPKFFVVIAILLLGAVLGGILLSGPSLIVGSPGTGSNPTGISQIEPLDIKLINLSVTKFSQRAATIEIAFEISNHNMRSVLVQTLDYQLFETNYSDSEQITGGQIGSRPGGMVEFSSNYFTLLGNNAITLKDTVTLRNTGNTPELWQALEDGTASWRVSGDVFYNLSSMTSGQENELHFEFTR